MSVHPNRNRGNHRNRQPRSRDLQVCWANVARTQAFHITLLHIAASEKMDVICVQEPNTAPGTITQTHPSYDHYAPVDSWDSTNETDREAERPRVMTYVRKGAGLRVQQRRPIADRDLLWTDVNGFAILNVYRAPLPLR